MAWLLMAKVGMTSNVVGKLYGRIVIYPESSHNGIAVEKVATWLAIVQVLLKELETMANASTAAKKGKKTTYGFT